jgi:predicted Zn-dependent protease
MTRNGEVDQARELLAGALTEFPDHAPLRFQYARTFYVSGDSLAMRRELEELLRRTPDHPLAARVRSMFPGAGRGK